MAMKVVMVLFFLAMLVSREPNIAMAQDPLDPVCAAFCVIKCTKRPVCLTRCLLGCAISAESVVTPDQVESQNRVCNVGCSLGHCSKYIVQYDSEKFGSCMTSCSDKYCIGGSALKKA